MIIPVHTSFLRRAVSDAVWSGKMHGPLKEDVPGAHVEHADAPANTQRTMDAVNPIGYQVFTGQIRC